MNELIFFAHIFIVIGFLIFSLRWGKEALIAFIALMGVLANFFVLKQISFFSFTITCSDVFAVGCLLGLNLLQEYFGKEIAKKTVRISFLAMIFFLVMANIHLLYKPSVFDTTQVAYQTLLAPTVRIIFSSLFVFYIIQKWDILFYGFLKRYFKDSYLTGRMILSLLISQLLDTVLFSFIGLYGLVESLFDIVLISFLVKVCVILLGAPLTSWAKKWVKAT